LRGSVNKMPSASLAADASSGSGSNSVNSVWTYTTEVLFGENKDL